MENPDLYLVPTPVGNLGDITSRAIAVLQDVDRILAEDTRNTGRLLKHFEISTPMSAYHAHNEHKATAAIVESLRSGQKMALVTDAGTPGISDPGYLLVRACHDASLSVSCLPGANALLPALAMSGIPCDRFYFEGFLPHKKGRQTRWKKLAELQVTTVLYESPHRILKCLREMIEHIGPNTDVAVVKEISKLYETIYRGMASEVLLRLEELPSIKGEYVVVFRGNDGDQ
ncbi:MAG: 16S rRNA (cytidine(1402)-2'-O)-methyltransferase [Bacteroidota bacterium]